MNAPRRSSRILVVDDVIENIQLAGTILKEKGYQLNIARNGKQALQVVEKTKPDLILMDVEMPEMNGYECCKVLKANPETQDIPIIFLTSNMESNDIVKGFELGAVDYVGKPFHASELLARIHTHLALRQAHLDLENLTQKASRYISPHVFQAIFKGEKDTLLTTTQKPLTVFFSDIVGFSNCTEKLGDQELTRWFNSYCEQMAAQVFKHGGTLDKFIGDAVMVFFGDPQSHGVKEDAVACVRMAIEMMQSAASMDIQIRAGINSGPAHVGNFGTQQQMNYTIMGNAVNMASRLEQGSEPGRILISQATYELVKDNFWCDVRGPIKIKGIEHEITTYWVNG